MIRAYAVVLTVLVLSCRGGVDSLRDPGTDVGIFFPRHSGGTPGNLAPAEGRLEVTNNCLWIITPSGPLLPIWPPGSKPEQADGALRVADATGRTMAVVGRVIRVVGGERSLRDAADLIGREPPVPCRAGTFYVVRAVESSP